MPDDDHHFIEEAVPYIDTLSLCVLWEYLCSCGYVSESKLKEKMELFQFDSHEDYLTKLRQNITDSTIENYKNNNDDMSHILGIVLDHMSIEDITTYWNTLKTDWQSFDE
jgi:hypothetical protein